MADLEPYPHGESVRRYRGSQDAWRSALDAREMFSYYSALPSYEEERAKDPDALRRLRQWREKHPELARKYPANLKRLPTDP